MGGEKRNEYLEVLTILLLGFLLRIYAGRNTIQGGNVIFQGYDEFYHMRRVLYTVTHFPNTIWFDSYINYPLGSNITWPPLFDQSIAAAALGLGQHSQHGIEVVGAIMPVVFGSAAIIVVYIMIREIFGRNIALLSAFMTALAPFFLLKTMLGATDHHSLEVLLFLCAVMFLVLAISQANRRLLFAAALGISMAALAYTWAGAAAYFGVIFIYFAIQLTVDLKENIPPSKELFIALLISLIIALGLTLPFWSKEWMSSSFFGLGAVAAGAIFLFGLGKIIFDKKVHWAAFPAAAIGLAGVLIIISKLFSSMPVFERINALIITGGEYVLGGGMAGMISEAEPLFSRPEYLFANAIPTSLGWNLIFAVVALVILIRYIWLEREAAELKRGKILFLVFASYSLILTLGQVRFLYISSVVMGILISILFFMAYEYVIKKSKARNNQSKLLLPLLFLVLILPSVSQDVYYTYTVPQLNGDWLESLKWLEQNSNTTSYYNDPIESPEYSLMVWWDYGNWALYEAKRPVVSNNFQVGVEDAARFYLSKNETEAIDILDNRTSKYVIADYSMIFGKINAIALWGGKNPSDYFVDKQVGSQMIRSPTENLRQTMLARLYVLDGNDMGHIRLVHESPTKVGGGGTPEASIVKIFEYVPGAIIKIITQPHQIVGVQLNMTSNQGRSFTYANKGFPQSDGYEVRVPYSKEKKYDTHAVDPYLVFSGNSSSDFKYTKVEVTVDDIINGHTIEVKL
jgi:oligosaccharyl transferase (archaeosortase A-associated)